MRVSEAIVFKNGLAFVTREGSVAFRDGEGRVSPTPDALLGTFWIAAGDRRVDAVRASTETVDVESDATTVAELLKGNPGKKVVLVVDEREHTGKLVASPETLVLLQVDGKVHAFPRDAVKSVAFAEVPSLKIARPESRTLLAIQSKGADGAVPVTMRYLRHGVSWIPEYTVELLDAERARVTMKATLVNDGEELRDTRIRFAVGYPNFSFSRIASPMTLQQSLQEFLTALSGGGFSVYGSNRIDNTMMVQMNNAMTNYATSSDQDEPGPSVPGAPTTGESAEDLFFYERDAVTLAKGERGLYPILSETVPFRHVYVWTVVSKSDQVWHSVSLANRGTTPWTTAPALVLSNGKPLAQDTLSYTAPGARASVKLTVATDVAVDSEEKEVERKPRDLERAGYTYDAVTVEGTLTMRSFKRDAITLDVTKTIEGQTLSRDLDGKVTRLALQPRAVNPTERLEWQVPLPAGETRTVKYRYKVWVRE